LALAPRRPLPDESRTAWQFPGRNELRRAEARSVAVILAEQMASLPIALAASAALSLATGGIADAVIIAAVVLLNASIATATRRKPSAILSLSNYVPLPVPVIRGGLSPARDPGDWCRVISCCSTGHARSGGCLLD
jgi:Ca2+-transporting ATPase